MLKDFLNTKYQEIPAKIYRMFESNEQKYKNIKNNILELIFGKNSSNWALKQIRKKSHSQPNSKYRRKNLQTKDNKEEKKKK